jgi:hypothetical protein
MSRLLLCLSKIVGITDDTTYTSDFELYLDQQAGISPLFASSVASGHDGTGNAVLRSSIDNAITGIYTDFGLILAPNYKVRNALEVASFGSQKAFEFVGSSGAYTMTLERRFNDRLAIMRVQRIGLMSYATGMATITLSDGLQSHAVTISAVANTIVFVNVDWSTPSEEMTISYTPLGGQIAQNELRCNSCKNFTRSSAYIYATSSDNYGGGLVVDVSVECDKSLILCAIRPYLASVLKLRACIEFCKLAMYTDRINGLAVNKQRIGEMRADYEAQYKEASTEFKNASSSIIANLNTPCLDCRGNKYTFKTG